MSRQRLIEGIHNYCDRCCHRCRFTSRCACAVVATPGDAADADPMQTITASMINSLGHAMTMVHQVAKDIGIDLNVTSDDLQEAERWHEEKVRRASADPLVAAARDYALQTMPIARALRPIVAGQPSPVLADAVSRIEEVAGSVASKIYRAVSSSLEPDLDGSDVQNDANGSAKVARLLIEESRRAWRTLMQAGQATANGVPARLCAVLDRLEADLATRFPRALEFVRPGFDTEDVDEAAQLAAAIREPISRARGA
jgi:hypothetical protein